MYISRPHGVLLAKLHPNWFVSLGNRSMYTFRNKAILHPFYRPSQIEEFNLCFQNKQTLHDEFNEFPVYLEFLDSNKVKKIRASPRKFAGGNTRVNWLEDCKRKIKTESEQKLQLISNNKDNIVSPSFIKLTNYPYLADVSDLFKDETLPTTDAVELNSLIDYALLNPKADIFVEDIYIYLLQNHVNTIEKLIFVISAVSLHLYSKIDHLKSIEKMIFQALFTLNNNIKSMKDIRQFYKVFETFIVKINTRFNIDDSYDHFDPILLNKLLEYHIEKTQNVAAAKILFKKLFNRKYRPNNTLILDFLKLLNSKVIKSERVYSIRIRKLLYLSDFRSIIENYPSVPIIEFLIPLCKHYNELKCLINIILKQENPKLYFNKLLPLVINKSVHFHRDPLLQRAINITDIYSITDQLYHGRIPLHCLEIFAINFAKLLLLPNLATLLNKNDNLCTSNFLETLIEALPKNKNRYSMIHLQQLRQFYQKYISPNDNQISSNSITSVKHILDIANPLL